MHRMHRAAGILPILILVLAACAAPGTGAGDESATAEPEMSQPASSGAVTSSPASSAEDDEADADEVQRVDIGVLAEDPATLEGQQVAVLARVDEVLVDGVAFLTSPSATEEGQFPVIVTPDAEVNKEISQASVLWLEGSIVALTQEDLDAAGVDVSVEELGVDGEFAFVATAVDDPLAQAGDGAE